MTEEIIETTVTESMDRTVHSRRSQRSARIRRILNTGLLVLVILGLAASINLLRRKALEQFTELLETHSTAVMGDSPKSVRSKSEEETQQAGTPLLMQRDEWSYRPYEEQDSFGTYEEDGSVQYCIVN